MTVATLTAPTPLAVRKRDGRPGMLEISRRFGPLIEVPPDIRVRPPLPLRPAMPELPLPVRRFLSIDEAAAYVGVSVSTFREEITDGRWPQPVRRGRTGRAVTWDVRALDVAADIMAGIAHPVVPLMAAEGVVSSTKAALMARFKQ